MKLSTFFIAFALMSAVTAKASEDPRLLQKLKSARFDLLYAIQTAEEVSGPATSAKFELDGDDLVFSVYTAPQGINQSPETTDLTEVSGPTDNPVITPKVEVFTDKEHIARASVHQTLMQLSSLGLADVIRTALKKEKGFAYSVKNPMVRNHKAVADVSILKDDGSVAVVTIDLMSGNQLKEVQ